MSYQFDLFSAIDVSPTSITFFRVEGSDSFRVSLLGTNLSYDQSTGVMSGTVTSIDLYDYSQSRVLQTITIDSATSGSVAAAASALLTRAVAVRYQFKFENVGFEPTINAAGTQATFFEYNKSGEIVGSFVVTGTGFHQGTANGTVTSVQHLDAQGVAIAGETISYAADPLSMGALMTAFGNSQAIYAALVVGNDRIESFSGTDLEGRLQQIAMDGGAGNDVLIESGLYGGVADYSHATGGVTVIRTGNGGTTTGSAGNDTLTNVFEIVGSAFNDTIYGSDGRDQIDGGPGADSLYGGADNDWIVWDPADVAVFGGAGPDALYILNQATPTDFDLTAHGFEIAIVETTNNPAYAYRRSGYNADWQLYRQTTEYLDGSSVDTRFDPTNEHTYSQINTYNNTSGDTYLQSVLFDDNSAQTNTFDATNIQTWTTAVTYYDTQLRTTLNSVAYDDGSSRSTYYDPGNVETWTSADTFYNVAGDTTLQSVANDNGSAQVQYWDTTNTQNWSTATHYYNASGQLTLTTGVYDAGGTFSF